MVQVPVRKSDGTEIFTCHVDAPHFLRELTGVEATAARILAGDAAQQPLSSLSSSSSSLRTQRRRIVERPREQIASRFKQLGPDTPSRSRRPFGARLTAASAIRKSEGAGKTGCALHPRSRVPNAQTKTHTSIQVQRRQSGLPCAMVLPVSFVLSPVTGFLATVACERIHKLDASTGASGPHDFAVRIDAVRRSAPPRPPHPAPR